MKKSHSHAERWMHRIAAVAGLALLISGTQLQAACAQPAALPLTPVQAESARTSPANGPSSDADTIAAAQTALTKMGLTLPNSHDALAVVQRD